MGAYFHILVPTDSDEKAVRNDYEAYYRYRVNDHLIVEPDATDEQLIW